MWVGRAPGARGARNPGGGGGRGLGIGGVGGGAGGGEARGWGVCGPGGVRGGGGARGMVGPGSARRGEGGRGGPARWCGGGLSVIADLLLGVWVTTLCARRLAVRGGTSCARTHTHSRTGVGDRGAFSSVSGGDRDAHNGSRRMAEREDRPHKRSRASRRTTEQHRQGHRADVDGIEVSRDPFSRVTDAVITATRGTVVAGGGSPPACRGSAPRCRRRDGVRGEREGHGKADYG